MIRIKCHKQAELFDPWAFLSRNEDGFLMIHGQACSRKKCYASSPSTNWSPFSGRRWSPAKELYTVLGVVMLRQVFDLSDEETFSQLAFNAQ